MPQNTLWELQPHTGAKHALLRAYLNAWFPILGSWAGRVVFIDGFAGPGQYAGGELGSPLIALDVAKSQKQRLARCELVLAFIEQDRGRFEHLQGLINGRDIAGDIPENVKCSVDHGSFSNTVRETLDSLGAQRLAPAFVMIDPFGVKDIPYDLLQRLASYPKTELLISFMYESINRFMSTPEFEPHLDILFGRQDWRSAIDITDSRRKAVFLHNLFRDQLQEAGMEYVRSFEMIDNGGRTEYFLFFATHHIRGLEVMKDAMWSTDPSGAYRFSDATNPDQLALFGPDPEFGELRASVMAEFAGRTVGIREIEDFVTIGTRFRKAHLRKNVLDTLDDEGRIQVTGQGRRHTYPSRTQITFP